MSKIALLEEPFKIVVGERGTDHMIGKLQKGVMLNDKMVVNSVLDGPVKKGQPIGGKVMFPNYIEAWGRRLITGKEREDKNRVEITDRDYVGEVEFLSYGDPNGYTIYARYVKGQASLDYHYQINRLGIVPITDDRNIGYLELPYGENDIFPTRDKAWSTMIQIHYMNHDSLCRNPDATMWMWKMVKELDVKNAEVKEIDAAFEAVKIVKESAASFSQLEVLKTILEQRVQIKWSKDDQNSLYESMLLYAKDDPKSFHESVNDYKRNISEMLSLCESFEAIDEKAKGRVVVLKPKTEILLDEVPVTGKDKDVYEWLFTNSMKPKVYEALTKLTTISKTFK